MHTDREALVAAIRERPDDDGPRLVLADWFEDQGDDASVARATFVRTQIARGRLAPQDPRQSELEARELRLLRQYTKAWCGSHPVFKKARFRRGFIEYVHLHLQHFQHHRRQMFALEPVRDVSLTGWMRAPDDLVRRVAACEEWRHVETLRIHHQGPHKSPRSNLVSLLESPHLTGLKSLRLPMLALDADARRRLERLPLLTRVSDISLPSLDTYPTNPGLWFAEGLPAGALARLRSLTLKDNVPRSEFLARLCGASFWNGLEAITANLIYSRANEVVALLRDRLPPGLKSLRLTSYSTPGPMPDLDSLWTGLSRRPLRRLEVHGVPIPPAVLASLLSADSTCELRELELVGCGLTDEHLALLAGSPGTSRLERLHLTEYQGVTPAAAERLLSSANFGSLVRLHLGMPSLWPDGDGRLPATPPWASLRNLTLTGGGFSSRTLARLLAAEQSSGIVRLTLENGHRAEFSPTAELLDVIGRLPHLARLRLLVNELPEEVQEGLGRLNAHVWSTVRSYDDPEDYRIEPGELPPLDEELDDLDVWV